MDIFHDILRSWSRIGIDRLIYPDGVELSAVLDCGCGSGIWAEQMLDNYDCDVSCLQLMSLILRVTTTSQI